MAVIDLDSPPDWFSPKQAADHLTPDQARKFAGTNGRVRLLTHPQVAGYIQNPISVYYCYDASGALKRGISEVTNTPWGERVTFVFDPKGQRVDKPLHVSPFMDMQNTWYLEAPEPTDTLRLTVLASHPEHGKYFDAHFVAQRARHATSPNEKAGWRELVEYGFMPHRVAFWIYWQALKLIWKGVPFYLQPPKSARPGMNASSDGNKPPKNGTTGQFFVWRAPLSFPWNAE